MTTFEENGSQKNVAALSFFVSAVSKTYPEIYIKFNTAKNRQSSTEDW